MRPLLVLALLALTSEAGADPRWPERSIRDAAAGCWDVGEGATLTMVPYGKHSLQAVARFSRRPRGGPPVMRGLAAWSRDRGAFEVACRPRSQHGSFCLVPPRTGRASSGNSARIASGASSSPTSAGRTASRA